MADKDPTETPAPEASAEKTAMRAGRPGVIDDGDIVSTAGGEPMSGLIADIADGDT